MLIQKQSTKTTSPLVADACITAAARPHAHHGDGRDWIWIRNRIFTKDLHATFIAASKINDKLIH